MDVLGKKTYCRRGSSARSTRAADRASPTDRFCPMTLPLVTTVAKVFFEVVGGFRYQPCSGQPPMIQVVSAARIQSVQTTRHTGQLRPRRDLGIIAERSVPNDSSPGPSIVSNPPSLLFSLVRQPTLSFLSIVDFRLINELFLISVALLIPMFNRDVYLQGTTYVPQRQLKLAKPSGVNGGST